MVLTAESIDKGSSCLETVSFCHNKTHPGVLLDQIYNKYRIQKLRITTSNLLAICDCKFAINMIC